MNKVTTFHSDSSIWYKPLSDIHFTLLEKEWSIAIGDDNAQIFPYAHIESIRINYASGGKNAPNKYCCILRLADKRYYTIKVADRVNIKQKIQEYKRFVELLIEKIQIHQPNATIRIGYNKATYRLLQLLLTIVVLIFVSVLIYFTTDEGRKELTVPLLIYIIPTIALVFLITRIYYLYKYRPYVLSIFDTIPAHVFPK